MSTIRNLFKGKKQKALEQFNIVNGDGGLTDRGQSEFVDYLWETDKTAKEGFIKKIVEAYEKTTLVFKKEK